MTHKEALTLALEALKPRSGMPEPEYESLVNCAITAIKEALAQPEQEPVAWITEKISGPTKGYMTVTFNKDTGWKNARSIPLYEHPPQRKPLSEAQLEKGRDQTFSINNPFCPCDSKTFRKVARWVEAAHDIKE